MTAAKGSTGAGNIAGMHAPQAAYTSTKYFHEIGPCAYRNWKSDSECYKLHGYDRSFNFTFGCSHLDKQGFVVDFGGLKEIKRQLEYWFDHTVILQADDPMVGTFRQLEKLGHLVLRTFPLISCEGLAQYVAEYVDHELQQKNGGRNWVISCEMIEAEKNSAIYSPRHDPERMLFPELQEIAKEMEISSGQFSL
ncbi:MAG: 6-carboxytetrahydropterin synthase [Thaumarchaeota archaeon]|nr:6-carboxytetrahydropterin synthase [Nitrososphaerota archaeon]